MKMKKLGRGKGGGPSEEVKALTGAVGKPGSRARVSGEPQATELRGAVAQQVGEELERVTADDRLEKAHAALESVPRDSRAMFAELIQVSGKASVSAVAFRIKGQIVGAIGLLTLHQEEPPLTPREELLRQYLNDLNGDLDKIIDENQADLSALRRTLAIAAGNDPKNS